MTVLQTRNAWKTATFAALAAVVAFASPAAAAVPSSTSVQASPSAATVGAPVELHATVTCAADPSGGLGMTYFAGENLLDTVPVGADGESELTTTFASPGTYTITAAYNGNDECFASNSETTVVVSAAPVPPTPSGGFCLLACGGLISFNAGNIHNEVNVH